MGGAGEGMLWLYPSSALNVQSRQCGFGWRAVWMDGELLDGWRVGWMASCWSAWMDGCSGWREGRDCGDAKEGRVLRRFAARPCGPC
eukprot:353195-Chlamydomonas_euryale.AAC.2